MYKNTQMQRTLWLVSSLICAIAALHIGLLGFGINLLHGPFIQMRLHAIIRPMDWIVGLAGLYLLVTSLMCAFGKCE